MTAVPVRAASVLSVLYLGLTALPLAAGGVGGARGLALAAHLGALALIWAAERARRSGSSARWAALVSDLHVLVLIPALYAELPLLMEGLPGEVVYHDRSIQSIEAAVFGYQPAWELAGRWPVAALSEVLHLAYLLYYPIIYVPPLLLYLARGSDIQKRGEIIGPDRVGWLGREPRREDNEPSRSESEFSFDRALLALSLSMLSCYLVFVVWPVQGPRYLGAPAGIPEGPMRAMVLTILQGGSSRGAAFPSSHVAVAVTQSLVMLRFRRPLGLGVAVTSVLLGFGAVYGGFHYAIDAFAGAAVGVAAWLASGALQRAFQRSEFGFAPARPPV